VRVSLALPLVVLACGKRSFDPADGGAAAPPASAILAIADAPTTLPPLQPPSPEKEDEPPPATPSPLAAGCEGVSLVIASVTKDSRSVRAVVELRNGSSSHVPLMLPGDGSGSGRRNPTVTFELSPNRVKKVAGCGNMNALSPREIVFLAPGSRTGLDWMQPPTPSKPGSYTLRATYRNDPTSERLGDNFPGPKTDALVARARKTAPCTLVSNTVTFQWDEPEEVPGAQPCRCEPGDPLCSCP
jgi:hypothetical protein